MQGHHFMERRANFGRHIWFAIVLVNSAIVLQCADCYHVSRHSVDNRTVDASSSLGSKVRFSKGAIG